MLVEDAFLYQSKKGTWEPSFIRIDSNGYLYKVKEGVLFYLKTGKFDLRDAAPYTRIGREAAFYGRPPLMPWMDENLIMYLPNYKKPKKDIWLYFLNYQQLGFWMNKMQSYL